MPSPHKDSYIPGLDGLRAISILLVIASHTVSRLVHQRVVNLGHMAVLIFFSLSGFLITTRLLEEHSANGKISLRNFYLRRAFRILPPALTYLGTVIILVDIGLVICSWSAIQSALLLYTNYADIGNPGWRVGHFWSLSVEEHFYLLWPCLLIFFGVRKGWRTAAIIACAVCFWSVLDSHYEILAHLFHAPYLAMDAFRTDLMADTLLWGCCLAFYLRSPNRILLRPASSTIIALAAAAALLAAYMFKLEQFTPLVHLLPAILIWAVVASPAAPICRFLELAPIRFIGRLSYSLYIWQQLFLRGEGQHLSLPLALLAIFTAAFLSYSLIERPCIRLGQRLVLRLQKNQRLREGQPKDATPMRV